MNHHAQTLSLSLSLSLLVASILLFLLPHRSHAASIIRAPNNLGLVGYWSFDEGRGDHASDLSGNGNDGAILNTTGSWWVTGKTGTAVDLDGSNDSIQTDHWYPLESLTFSAWIYPTRNNAVEGYGRTIAAASSQTSFYNFWLLLSGSELRLMTYGSTPVLTNISGANIGLNQWHHVAFTTSRNGDMVVYVDGVKVHESSAGTVSGTAGYLTIGDLRPNRSISFDGSIDEVRAYSRELSGTEIQNLYNNTKGVIVGTTNNTYTDGLVAHYTFDGSTISGNTLKDVAGSNDGVINNATPIIGRIGQGMQFTGASSFIGLDITQTFPGMTVAFWANPDSNQTSDYPRLLAVEIGGTHADHELSVADANAYRFRFGIGEAVNSDSNFFIPGELHHYAATYDLSSIRFYRDGVLHSTKTMTRSPTAFTIKRIADNVSSTRSYRGLLDDFRVYDRAISPEEVRGLAGSSIATLHSSSDNLVTSGLVGHWSFDSETISSTTVSDMSVNQNHGTISGSGSVTQVSGAVGGALEFGGSGARVVVGDPPDNSLDFGTGDFSLSLWVRVDALPNDWKTLVTKGASGSVGYEIEISNNNRYTCSIQATGGSNIHRYGPVATLGTWQHVVCIYDRDVGIIQYVDGEFTFSEAFGGGNTNSVNTSYPFVVGARENAGWAFSGGLDDIRVYSRVLSESEVQALYSMGQ